MNFLEQQQRLVHLVRTLLTVLGLLVFIQNILLHYHEPIKCIVVLAWFPADTNGTNCMVPLLVTEIHVLQRIGLEGPKCNLSLLVLCEVRNFLGDIVMDVPIQSVAIADGVALRGILATNVASIHTCS